nr:hypothetical protein CFP56_31542 [Quercus suber]
MYVDVYIISVQQTAVSHLLNIFRISRGTAPPQPLSILDKQQKRRTLCHARKRGDDERILQAHVRHPRRDSVANGERHGISDQDHRHHSFPRQVRVAVNAVRDGKLEADRVCERDDAHGEHAAEPLDGMSGTDAPENQAKRDQNQRGQEKPQSMLGFQNAVVASRHVQNYPVSNPACVETTYDNADQRRHIGKSHCPSREVVRCTAKDKRRRAVEYVEPDQIRAIRESSISDHWKSEEDERPRHHACDADFTQRLNRSPEKALQHLVGYPLAIACRVRCPDLYSHGGENADQIYWSFTKLKSKRLPEQAALHWASVDRSDQLSFLSSAGTSHSRATTHLQTHRIIRVGGWSWDQYDVSVRVFAMLCVHRAHEIHEVDGSGDGRRGIESVVIGGDSLHTGCSTGFLNDGETM